mmetsp:Transcript_31353/g.81919  ORF Transcript_31353/g.81919 Transcript_31353/m.81919 type:complete len:217 (-) Transcript_31353:981-1631(-)
MLPASSSEHNLARIDISETRKAFVNATQAARGKVVALGTLPSLALADASASSKDAICERAASVISCVASISFSAPNEPCSRISRIDPCTCKSKGVSLPSSRVEQRRAEKRSCSTSPGLLTSSGASEAASPFENWSRSSAETPKSRGARGVLSIEAKKLASARLGSLLNSSSVHSSSGSNSSEDAHSQAPRVASAARPRPPNEASEPGSRSSRRSTV